MVGGDNMKYIPIIKMKNAEIRLADYASDYFKHNHLLPFLELIYESDAKGTNKSFHSFLEKIGCEKYFLGIPHKQSALVKKDTMYVSKVNKSKAAYFSASLKLLDIENAIPVFYVYDEEDAHYAFMFMTKAKKENKSIGIVITTSTAKNIDFSLLSENDYVFVDIDSDKLSSKRISLNNVLASCKSRIVLMRENRRNDLMNNVISTGATVPFECDLSSEIKATMDELKFNLYGFADFCGHKNTIATSGGGGNRDKMFPGWAMYSRKSALPEFIGIRSTIPLTDQMASFSELRDLSIAQMKAEKNIDKTTSMSMLNNESIGAFPFWNVLTQWHYLSQMVIYDDWKDIN